MFCKDCGQQVPDESKFCGYCGVPFSVQGIPRFPGKSVAKETKSGGTGIVLSFFWTGLGQLYAGSIARGLVMMTLTPFIWAIGWFGGFATMLGGIGALVAPSAQESASASGLGFLGLMMALGPVTWWIWGMVDAKKLCEAFNQSTAT